MKKKLWNKINTKKIWLSSLSLISVTGISTLSLSSLNHNNLTNYTNHKNTKTNNTLNSNLNSLSTTNPLNQKVSFATNSVSNNNTTYLSLKSNSSIYGTLNNFLNTLLNVCNANNLQNVFYNSLGWDGSSLISSGVSLTNISILPLNVYNPNNAEIINGSKSNLIPYSSITLQLALTFNEAINSNAFNNINLNNTTIWQYSTSNSSNTILYFNFTLSDASSFYLFNFANSTNPLTNLMNNNSILSTSFSELVNFSSNSIGINQFALGWNSTTNRLSVNFGFYNLNSPITQNETLVQSVTTPKNKSQIIDTPNVISNNNGLAINTSNSLLSVNYETTPDVIVNINSNNELDIDLSSSNLFCDMSYFNNAINNNQGIINSTSLCNYLSNQLFSNNTNFHILQFQVSNFNSSSLMPSNSIKISNIWLINTKSSNYINPFIIANNSTSDSSNVISSNNIISNNSNNISNGSGINVSSLNIYFSNIYNNATANSTEIANNENNYVANYGTSDSDISTLDFGTTINSFSINKYDTSSHLLKWSTDNASYQSLILQFGKQYYQFYWFTSFNIANTGINYIFTIDSINGAFTFKNVSINGATSSILGVYCASCTIKIKGNSTSQNEVLFLVPASNININSNSSSSESSINVTVGSGSYQVSYDKSLNYVSSPLIILNDANIKDLDTLFTQTNPINLNMTLSQLKQILNANNGNILPYSSTQWILSLMNQIDVKINDVNISFIDYVFSNSNNLNLWIVSLINAINNAINSALSNISALKVSWTLPNSLIFQNYNNTSATNLTLNFTLNLASENGGGYTYNNNDTNAIDLATYINPLTSINSSYLTNTSSLYNNYFANNDNGYNLNDLLDNLNDLTSFNNLTLLSQIFFNYFTNDLNSSSLTSFLYNAIKSYTGATSGILNINNLSVLSYQVDGSKINHVIMLINDTYFDLGAISFNLSLNANSFNVGISSLGNVAKNWINWINSWKGTTITNDQFSTNIFNTNYLTFAPLNYSFNNEVNTSLANMVNTNLFTYNTTGYISSNANNTVSWFTWTNFSNFISLIYNDNPNVFKNINVLSFGNVDFSSENVNNIISSIQTWFPNLTTLTIQNSSLSGSLDLNSINANKPLININLNHNNLSSVVLNGGLNNVDLSNNNISSLNSGYELVLPTTCFDISYNNLTTLPATIKNSNSGNDNLSIFNVSHNQLTSIDLSSIIQTTNYQNPNLFTLNISYNQLLNITGFNLIYGTSNYSFNENNNGNYSLIYNNKTMLNFDFSNQHASGNWLFKINNSTNTLLSEYDITANNNATNSNGISFSNLLKPITISNNGLNSVSDIANYPFWISNYLNNNSSLGVISKKVFDANVNNTKNLNSLFNPTNANSTTIKTNLATNGLWMINNTNFNDNCTLTLNNSQSISSITYNTFVNIYNSTIPYDDASLYEILNNKQLGYNELINIFSQGFNLMSQNLIKVNFSSLSDTSSIIQSTINNMLNTNSVLGLTSNNQVIIYQSGNDYYYISSSGNSYSANISPYSTLSIANTNMNSTLNLNIILTNDITSPISINNNIASKLNLSNVNQISLNHIWSLNGTSGFYNLATSGILNNLSLDPFSLGVNYSLYYQFMNKDIYDTQSLSNLIGNDSNFSEIVSGLKADNLYQEFENNFYLLLEQEGIIKYQQIYSLYGTYDSSTRNFNLSQTLINSDLNLSFSNSSSNNINYGINANAQSSVIDELNVVGSDYSSFYQSDLWANFVNTEINLNYNQKNKSADYETIGAYLYNENNGNWNYEMPNSSDSVFNYPNAKTAYSNLLSLFNLSNNLSTSQFNNAMSKIYVNFYSESLNNDTYSSALGANLFQVFSYNDGTITNAYNLFSNSSQWFAVSLNYINSFSNIANTKDSYVLNAVVYSESYFSNSTNAFNDLNNIVANDTTYVSLANTSAYNWNQLEENELQNLIPMAVYNNVNPVDSNNSSNWVPVVDFNQIMAKINQNDLIAYSVIGVLLSIIGIGIVSYSVFKLTKRHKQKAQNQAKATNSKKRLAQTLSNKVKKPDTFDEMINENEEW